MQSKEKRKFRNSDNLQKPEKKTTNFSKTTVKLQVCGILSSVWGWRGLPTYNFLRVEVSFTNESKIRIFLY